MTTQSRVAVVTGGAQGLGRGIADCLARDGDDIAIVDINGEGARQAAEEIAATGRQTLAVTADLTDSAQVARAIAEVVERFGRIDVLVNNAGGYPPGDFFGAGGMRIVDRTEEEWDGTYAVNLKTTVMTCRAVIPQLTGQKSGKIVNISSVSAVTPSGALVCYATAKAAVVHYTRMLARELAGDNVNVNCVLPGVIYTPLWERLAVGFAQSLPENEAISPREWFERNIVPGVPLGRAQTAEDIGEMVAFLVSERARNITAQSICVDGGSSFV